MMGDPRASLELKQHIKTDEVLFLSDLGRRSVNGQTVWAGSVLDLVGTISQLSQINQNMTKNSICARARPYPSLPH